MANPQLNFMNGSSYTTITPVRVSSSTEDDYIVTISQNNASNQPLQITVDDSGDNRNLFVVSNSGYVGVFDLDTQTWKMQINDFDGLKSKGMVYTNETLDDCYCSAQESTGQWLRIWCKSDAGNRGLICTDSSISVWDSDNQDSILNLSKLTAYPIGSIYMSFNTTSPSTLFGGSWSQITNRFLYCVSSSTSGGSTGGNSSHLHTYNDNSKALISFNSNGSGLYMRKMTTGITWSPNWGIQSGMGAQEVSTTFTSGASLAGATNDADNLPPYYAIHAWRRTA